MIYTYRGTITVAGSAGSATGSTSIGPINGLLHAVFVDYTSQPATADLTLAMTGPAQTLLTIANNGTDRWAYPRALMQGVDGANLTGVYDRLAVDGTVTASIAQGDAGSVDVYLLVDKD